MTQSTKLAPSIDSYRAGYGVADLLDPLRDKSQKSEAGDIVNNFISYKPASCKWHHTTWTNSTVREKFEWCTGVKAAMRQVETTSVALFVVSTFLSPGGLAFMPIAFAIEFLLNRSCKKYVMANRKRRSQFWDPDEIGVDELGFFGEKWRNIKEVASWKFVQDTLLGPIYNGKISLCMCSNTVKGLKWMANGRATCNFHLVYINAYNMTVCRFLGKLGLKPFDKAAKGMRPVMKASRIKEEKYADFCVRYTVKQIGRGGGMCIMLAAQSMSLSHYSCWCFHRRVRASSRGLSEGKVYDTSIVADFTV